MNSKTEKFAKEHLEGKEAENPIFFVIAKLINIDGYPHQCLAANGYASGSESGSMPAECLKEVKDGTGMILETANLIEMYFGLREFIAEICIENEAPGLYYRIVADLQEREHESSSRVSLKMGKAGYLSKEGELPSIAGNGSGETPN